MNKSKFSNELSYKQQKRRKSMFKQPPKNSSCSLMLANDPNTRRFELYCCKHKLNRIPSSSANSSQHKALRNE